MKIKNFGTLINVIIMVSLFAFCVYSRNTAYCAQDIILGNMYQNMEYEFRIIFPEEWEVARGDGTNYIVNAEGPDNSSMNINVESTDPKYTADMLSVKDVGYITYGLRNTFPDLVLLNSSETQISNRKALMIVCNYTVSSTKMKVVQYITIYEGKIFTIMCTAPSGQYGQYGKMFTNSIFTFMLGDFLANRVEPESEEDQPGEEHKEIPEKRVEEEHREQEYQETEIPEKHVEEEYRELENQVTGVPEKHVEEEYREQQYQETEIPEKHVEEEYRELENQVTEVPEKHVEEEYREQQYQETEIPEKHVEEEYREQQYQETEIPEKHVEEEYREQQYQETEVPEKHVEEEYREQQHQETKVPEKHVEEEPQKQEYERGIRTDAEIQDTTHFNKIVEAHPDYIEIAHNQGFAGFVNNLPSKQSEAAKRIVESGTSEEIILLLSDYKEHLLHLETIDFPLPEMYVEDLADIIDKQTENRLNAYLEILENKTATRMIVLTIGTVGEVTMKQFSNDLMEKWKLGRTEKNNGVLIVIAFNDMKYSIKLDSGLKAKLTNKFCANAGKTLFVPNFIKGNYSQGIYQGAIAIINEIAQEEISKIHTKGDVVTLHDPDDGTVGIYDSSSLDDIAFLFTDGVEATVVDVKIPDGLPVLYKVQVWEHVGWITENDISD